MTTDNTIKVKVTIYKKIQWDEDWPPENLLLFIARFNEKLKEIPIEYRNSAQISIEGITPYGNDPRSEIKIFYYRDLTTEERTKMKASKERNKQAIREHELKELERLTNKYRKL
jgi:hypothetical protein